MQLIGPADFPEFGHPDGPSLSLIVVHPPGAPELEQAAAMAAHPATRWRKLNQTAGHAGVLGENLEFVFAIRFSWPETMTPYRALVDVEFCERLVGTTLPARLCLGVLTACYQLHVLGLEECSAPASPDTWPSDHPAAGRPVSRSAVRTALRWLAYRLSLWDIERWKDLGIEADESPDEAALRFGYSLRGGRPLGVGEWSLLGDAEAPHLWRFLRELAASRLPLEGWATGRVIYLSRDLVQGLLANMPDEILSPATARILAREILPRGVAALPDYTVVLPAILSAGTGLDRVALSRVSGGRVAVELLDGAETRALLLWDYDRLERQFDWASPAKAAFLELLLSALLRDLLLARELGFLQGSTADELLWGGSEVVLRAVESFRTAGWHFRTLPRGHQRSREAVKAARKFGLGEQDIPRHKTFVRPSRRKVRDVEIVADRQIPKGLMLLLLQHD
jgi:hypothetical protein